MSSLGSQEGMQQGGRAVLTSPLVPQTGRCHPGCGSTTRHRPPARTGGGGLRLPLWVPWGLVPGETLRSPHCYHGDAGVPPYSHCVPYRTVTLATPAAPPDSTWAPASRASAMAMPASATLTPVSARSAGDSQGIPRGPP